MIWRRTVVWAFVLLLFDNYLSCYVFSYRGGSNFGRIDTNYDKSWVSLNLYPTGPFECFPIHQEAPKGKAVPLYMTWNFHWSSSSDHQQISSSNFFQMFHFLPRRFERYRFTTVRSMPRDIDIFERNRLSRTLDSEETNVNSRSRRERFSIFSKRLQGIPQNNTSTNRNTPRENEDSSEMPKSLDSEIKPFVQALSVGIDLGTTNSAVSIYENGRPVIIPVDDQRILPSVVSYKRESDIIVGELAKKSLIINPKNTFSSVKRIIGRKKSSSNRSGRNSINIKAGISLGKLSKSNNWLEFDNDNSLQIISEESLNCPVLKKTLSPEEVSAEILRKLLMAASNYTGKTIENAVITVPAYFSSEQCSATEVAGKLAGLKKVKLLKEPEAAALAYGLTRKDQQLVLVFDLGGGTFDVSVLEVGGGFVEVIATSGDSFLGGDDFDAAVADWILHEISKDSVVGLVQEATGGKDDENIISLIKSDPITLSRVYVAAEMAKNALSSIDSTKIEIVDILGTGHSFETQLTRKKFESLTKSLLRKLLRPLREVALMAGINLPGESGQLGIDSRLSDEDKDNETAKQIEGRKLARERRKVKGKSTQELRRVQSTVGQQISLFPGGKTIDEVILVGGATRIPAVRRLVRTITGVDPKSHVNVDEAVSLGAAIMAAIMDGVITDMQVLSAFQAAVYRALIELKKNASIVGTSE